MNVKPLGARVLVRRSKVQQTKGGILLPDSAQEKPREGEVLAVGPGTLQDDGSFEPLPVKRGDVVLFSSYGGTKVSSEGDEELLLLSLTDILGVMTEA